MLVLLKLLPSQTQHSEPRESKRPQIVKENRFPITSAAHRDRVERKRKEWRERREERRERRFQREAELSSEEAVRKEKPSEKKTVVENGERTEGVYTSIGWLLLGVWSR